MISHSEAKKLEDPKLYAIVMFELTTDRFEQIRKPGFIYSKGFYDNLVTEMEPDIMQEYLKRLEENKQSEK